MSQTITETLERIKNDIINQSSHSRDTFWPKIVEITKNDDGTFTVYTEIDGKKVGMGYSGTTSYESVNGNFEIEKITPPDTPSLFQISVSDSLCKLIKWNTSCQVFAVPMSEFVDSIPLHKADIFVGFLENDDGPIIWADGESFRPIIGRHYENSYEKVDSKYKYVLFGSLRKEERHFVAKMNHNLSVT